MRIRIRIKVRGIRTGLEPQGAPFLSLRRCLNPASALALGMAIWRLGYDLEWTGQFAISGGLFSHWQVWMALALVLRVVEARTSLAN
ncbi:MAG TPA: hypothetical protein VLH09_14570 [Bryobacteraceae bacterium]|nr:hypothetical protein [Bryobacteraceae bacterium]